MVSAELSQLSESVVENVRNLLLRHVEDSQVGEPWREGERGHGLTLLANNCISTTCDLLSIHIGLWPQLNNTSTVVGVLPHNGVGVGLRWVGVCNQTHKNPGSTSVTYQLVVREGGRERFHVSFSCVGSQLTTDDILFSSITTVLLVLHEYARRASY